MEKQKYEWIFWRHAEAGFGYDDLERPLTERGQRQAADSAAWLKKNGIHFPAYCSEALRGRQTAVYYDQMPTVLPGLNPDCGINRVRETLRQLEGKNAVIVGHLPWIHRVSCELLKEDIRVHNYSSWCWLQNDNGIWMCKDQYRF